MSSEERQLLRDLRYLRRLKARRRREHMTEEQMLRVVVRFRLRWLRQCGTIVLEKGRFGEWAADYLGRMQT